MSQLTILCSQAAFVAVYAYLHSEPEPGETSTKAMVATLRKRLTPAHETLSLFGRKLQVRIHAVVKNILTVQIISHSNAPLQKLGSIDREGVCQTLLVLASLKELKTHTGEQNLSPSRTCNLIAGWPDTKTCYMLYSGISTMACPNASQLQPAQLCCVHLMEECWLATGCPALAVL